MDKIITSSKIARIVSILFVPPSFTILIFTYFAFALENSGLQFTVTLIAAYTFGFAFHVMFFFYLRKKGKLGDNEASVKEERELPYLVAIFFYIGGLLLLIFAKVNIITIAFWFCYISNTFFIFIINRKWKISAHTMGAGGPLAAITYVLGPVGLFFSIILISIGWARVKLNLHNLSQVIAGAMLGFFSTYLQMYLIIHYFTK